MLGLLYSPVGQLDWDFNVFPMAAIGIGVLLYAYAEMFLYTSLRVYLSKDRASKHRYFILASATVVVAVLAFLLGEVLHRMFGLNWTGDKLMAYSLVAAVPLWATIFLRYRLIRKIQAERDHNS